MKEKIKNFLLSETSLQESSKDNYRSKLCKLAGFLEHDPDFTEQDVLRFFNSKDFKALEISTRNLYKTVIRQFLKFLGMNHELIKLQRYEPDIIKKEDLPTKREINQLLEGMHRVMDKCLLMIFLEGLRLNEARNVQIRDVVNRETHMVIHVRVSKSRKRPVPIVNSVPFIIDWLNQHPDKNNPDAHLFCHKRNGKIVKYSTRGLQQIISRNNALTKKVHPHLFRHAAATNDYGKLTEKEMMMKYGWKTRGMIDRYAHLVDTDLENKILQLHGIMPQEPRDDGITLIENKTCPRCQFTNPGTNTFCSRCGSALDIITVLKAEENVEMGEKTLSKDELYELFMNWYKKEYIE